MTRDEIIARTALELEDLGNTHFTQTDLTDSVQDGYDLLALMTECVENVATVNYVNNQTYYDFSSLISDYYRVFAIWSNLNSRWLKPVTYAELDEENVRWETTHGAPRNFTVLGQSLVAIYPKQETASSSMLVLYKAQANVLSGATVPTFPPATHEALVEYMISDLMDQDLEFTKSLNFYKRFYSRIPQIKEIMNKRSMPDRILALVEQVPNAPLY